MVSHVVEDAGQVDMYDLVNWTSKVVEDCVTFKDNIIVRRGCIRFVIRYITYWIINNGIVI